VVVGDHVYIAGVYASTEPGLDGGATGGGMYGQAVAVFTRIKHLVEAAGGTMSDVVKVMIFVTDIGQRQEIWKARREFFSGDFPPSTMVEVRALANPDLLITAEAVAVLGSGRPG
jgi:enamine deaminase RidA (YjgF/YER057c/UK114 family)